MEGGATPAVPKGRGLQTRFRALLALAPDAMVVISMDGLIVAANQQAVLLFQRSRQEMVGNPVEMLVPDRFRLVHREHRGRYSAQPEARPMGGGQELFGLRADGSEFPVEISLSPLESESETVVVAALRDLTGRRQIEDRLRDLAAIFETSDDAILISTLDGTISAWNAAAEALYGYRAEEVIGRSLSLLVPPERSNEVVPIFGRIIRGERVEHFETVRVRKDGSLVDVSLRVSPVRDALGRITGASAVVRDITAAKQAREDLAAANHGLAAYAAQLEQRNHDLLRVSEIAEMLQSVVSEPEIHQIVQEYGPQLLPDFAGRLFMRSASATHVELVACWGGDSRSPSVISTTDCWALRRGRVCGRPHPDNAPRCPHLEDSVESYACIPLIAKGEAVGVLHLVASDATPERSIDAAGELLAATLMENVALALTNFRLREMLRLQALQDAGTGLFNRRYMEQALERELKRAERASWSLGLIMLDVDGFKAFNDTYGHDAADALLRELARVLQRGSRGGDIACRYGGDEFLLLLPQSNLEATTLRARDLLEAIRVAPVRHLGRLLPNVTVTMGVAAYPEDGNDVASLIRAADDALRRGKRTGKDRVESTAGSLSSIVTARRV